MAFVHRYSLKMKKWLLTSEVNKVKGKGQWVDLRKCESVVSIKDYDDDDEHDNPMEEDVIIPDGYVDYSCKYCKLSMLDDKDNYLPSSMLTCASCKKFMHGDTCLDPPLPPKTMDKYYAPPELMEDRVRVPNPQPPYPHPPMCINSNPRQ